MWPYPKIVAHRGGGTLAPENTFAALRCGLAYGFHAVEFDVMLARDGVGVVVHDEILGRSVAGAGKVGDYTSGELAALDAGGWFSPLFGDETVPEFSRFIAYCKAQHIWMNIEIKPAEGADAETGRVVAGVTRGHFSAELGAGDPARLPLLSSFSVAALNAARSEAPELSRAWLTERIPAGWQVQAAALGVVAVHTNHQHLTAALAQEIKRAGLGLFCYTVNEPERARELLGWGVDGICTDRIDLIGPDFA